MRQVRIWTWGRHPRIKLTMQRIKKNQKEKYFTASSFITDDYICTRLHARIRTPIRPQSGSGDTSKSGLMIVSFRPQAISIGLYECHRVGLTADRLSRSHERVFYNSQSSTRWSNRFLYCFRFHNHKPCMNMLWFWLQPLLCKTHLTFVLTENVFYQLPSTDGRCFVLYRRYKFLTTHANRL